MFGGSAAQAQESALAPGGEQVEEVEEIVVQATRSGRRVQDEPIRVEVINQEEIEEKLLMTPGNISMLVAETGGLRVQVTSPALGSANVRVRGLEGRYTQLLADGLPLYGQASSIGLLQIAPTDLGQVEVIKGAASALYGPSALGGVINLVARRPGDAPEAELLLNATTRNGQDATAYAASPLREGFGLSLVGGYHRQTRQDLDGDGWADMPGYDRFTVRPRLFWEGADGAKAFVTVGAMTEDRVGGTLPGRTTPDGRPFPQTQETTRFDAGLVAETPVGEFGTFHLRASGMTQDHRHRFGELIEDDRHATLFGEASFAADSDRTSWLLGAAIQRDTYRSETFPAFDYTYTVPGLFAQVEHEATDDLTFAGSARLDDHSEYGTFFSPRLSALYRPGRWTVRASVGRGFYAPTPFVDEIEAAGLSRLEPLSDLKAEKANTASLDVGYSFGRTELIAALFASEVDDAVRLEQTGPERVRLVNVEGSTRTRGVELLARHRWENFSVTGSYVHVDAAEPSETGPGRQRIARTPRNTAGVIAMWEEHGKGRIGIEAYYTGRQRLEDNPYRETSRPYVELGMLAEVVFGRASLFLNLENILNVRQTKYDPLLLPQRAADGRWTVDVWAPTEGFVANGGVRLRFGGSDH
jgi:iron complex outermembrane receptor protein